MLETFKFQMLDSLFPFSFSLKLNMSYGLKQFYFSESPEVFRVKFHWSFISGDAGKFHFFTTRSNTMQFSKILKMRKFRPYEYFVASYFYSISQELFLTQVSDKFQTMKRFFQNPLSFFSGHDDLEDVNVYLFRLLRGFKELHNKVTLSLPLSKDLFDLEVDEQAFEDYLSETDEADRWAPISSNYRREYAVNYLRNDYQSYANVNDIDNETRPDLSFSLIHFKKVIVATNDYNYAKFIVNLLNVLSTWFSLKLLDVPVYAQSIRKALRRVGSSLLRRRTNRVLSTD